MFKNLLLALLLFPALAFAQVTPTPNNVNGGLNAAPSNLTAPVKLGTPKITDTGVLLQATSDPGNTYNQFIIQNTDAGNAASANFVVNNNLGTASTYYGEFGMNSSTFSGSGSLNLANGVYLDAKNGDLALGTLTSNPIHFVVNNGATDAVTISTSGTVGIGTAVPGSALDVNGAIDVSELNAISFPAVDSTLGNSIAIGNGAMSAIGTSSAAFQNLAVGVNTLHGTMTTAAIQNTAVGSFSLAALTSGAENTCLGRSSCNGLLGGSNNTGLGEGALKIGTSSAQIVAVGFIAASALTGGNNIVVIGPSVASTTLATGTNDILIGTHNGIDTPLSSTSNFLDIGNLIYGTNLVSSGTTPGGSVGIGTAAPLTGSVLTMAGHPAYYQAAVPVVTSCGSGTAAASSTDNKGQITGITAATACTITFGSTMPTAPSCTFSTSTGIAVGISSISTSAVTTSMAALTGTLYYICQ